MSAVTVTGRDVDTSVSVAKKSNVAEFVSDSKKPTAGLTTVDTMGKTFNVPDYTIKDILLAIPKECYERSLVRSLGYVARDIISMVAIGYVGHKTIPLVDFAGHETASYVARGALWMVQSYLISLFGFGLWILAHECGHGAFSDYQNINDFVGWVLHSYLVVPYFSWKFSHAKHHKATGHMTRDTVFVPHTKESYMEVHNVTHLSELVEDLPIYSASMLLFQQLGGLQFYLATNATGQPHNLPWYAKSHYAPNSPVFDPHQYWYIVLSDIGMVAIATVVYQWARVFGTFNMMVDWFVPWLWVNHWLVMVTFLQHTDPTMPHYSQKEWTFARGAAATIDRNFGFVGQHIFHDIIETHVLHHYVSRIPFYNARKASAAIQKVMGLHYRYDGENMWVSLWKVVRSCRFVSDEKDNGVYMFRNVNGVGVAPK